MPSCEALNVNAPQEAVVHFLTSMLQLLTNSSQPLTLPFSSWDRVCLEDKMEKAHFWNLRISVKNHSILKIKRIIQMLVLTQETTRGVTVTKWQDTLPRHADRDQQPTYSYMRDPRFTIPSILKSSLLSNHLESSHHIIFASQSSQNKTTSFIFDLLV